METSSILLGIAFLVVFTAPVAYAVMSKSKKKKYLLNLIQEKAAIHQITLKEINIFGDYFIAANDNYQQVVYGNLESLDKKLHILNLKNYTVELLEQRKKDKSISQVSLLFKSQKEQHVFNFYEDEDNVKVAAVEQLELAKKWHNWLK